MRDDFGTFRLYYVDESGNWHYILFDQCIDEAWSFPTEPTQEAVTNSAKVTDHLDIKDFTLDVALSVTETPLESASTYQDSADVNAIPEFEALLTGFARRWNPILGKYVNESGTTLTVYPSADSGEARVRSVVQALLNARRYRLFVKTTKFGTFNDVVITSISFPVDRKGSLEIRLNLTKIRVAFAREVAAPPRKPRARKQTPPPDLGTSDNPYSSPGTEEETQTIALTLMDPAVRQKFKDAASAFLGGGK